jgi:hypothetical protein
MFHAKHFCPIPAANYLRRHTWGGLEPRGSRGTLVLLAALWWGWPGPSITFFDVYRLTRSDGDIGSTTDFFEHVSHARSTTKFCNAQMALFKAFGLARQASYAGPRTADGCPKD